MDEKLKRAIEEMAKGKEEGFNAVYSATYNHVYFRAKAYMKDEADAQDLTQIIYIEAYKNIKSLQNAESLFGWLDGICHNQGMKIFRKKKDVLPNVDEEGKDIFETLESNDITSLPELSTDQKETSRIIQEFIGELPEVQKAAVIAYYFDGFSVGEIAQMQDCSEGTVKSRLNYARKFLKDKVEGMEKRDGIRLHVVALPTLYYAIKLMSENTKLSAKAAEGIYVGSCAKVGLTPGAIALGNAGAGMSAKMAVSGAVKVAEDCGDDGIPELALHIISPVPDIEPWNEYIVIKNIDGRLETIYSNIAWSRYTIEMNEYGYVSSSGSGGAYSNGKENGFLNKEGNYYDTYINDVEINPETNEETDNVTGMSEEESSAIGLTQKIKDGKVPVWTKLK